MYLIKYFSSLKDIDTESFCIVSDDVIKKLEELKESNPNQKIYICKSWTTIKEFVESFFIKKLNEEEMNVLMKLFGVEFGTFNLSLEIDKILNEKAFEENVRIKQQREFLEQLDSIEYVIKNISDLSKEL